MNMTPVAQAVQRQGRGDDTMLVHMTPGEVGGLQALAMAHGGSLSINPNTGLPEAGFLKNILPTVLGIALTPFMGPMAAGLTVGGLETVRTGDVGKGFLAGLGAFGGANLAGSLASTGASTAASAAPGVSEAAASGALPQASMSLAPSSIAPTVGETALQASVAPAGTSTGGSLLAANPVTAATTMGATLPTGYAAMGEGARSLGTEAGRQAFVDASGGLTGLATNVGMAASPMAFAVPEYAPPATAEEESDYEGPYTPTRREVRYPTDEERRRTSEFMYFNPSNPVPFAEGGETSNNVMVSPNEAEVYQDIMNVQQLAGLRALDPTGFTVAPRVGRERFVYQPIAGYDEPGSMREIDYGFRARSPMENTQAGIGGVQFFQPVPGSGFNSGFLSRATGKELQYEPFTPKGRVDMSEYSYDPKLGGYVKTSSRSGLPFANILGYAEGGVPTLEDGGFVLTKKAVDGLGKGSNKRGQQVASAGLGAIPIKGAGAKRGPKAGVDDKIKTSIEGKRPALVSNGEAYVPKKQVAKRGGAKAFYALMDKAEKRAKKA